ncbi:MAG: hypothetical protein AB7S39_10875 [Gemmatimonadales bacterium]
MNTLIWLLWLLQPATVATDLGPTAERVQAALESRRFGDLLGDRPVRLELPNDAGAVTLRGGAAAAALAGVFRRTEDVVLERRGAAVVAPGQGYLEIRRRFRVHGTQEEQVQRILVAVALVDGAWRVGEIWISPPEAGTGRF